MWTGAIEAGDFFGYWGRFGMCGASPTLQTRPPNLQSTLFFLHSTASTNFPASTYNVWRVSIQGGSLTSHKFG
jgi:hypothetical protein